MLVSYVLFDELFVALSKGDYPGITHQTKAEEEPDRVHLTSNKLENLKAQPRLGASFDFCPCDQDPST